MEQCPAGQRTLFKIYHSYCKPNWSNLIVVNVSERHQKFVRFSWKCYLHVKNKKNKEEGVILQLTVTLKREVYMLPLYVY